jgi:hypothetical protein
MLEKEGGSAMSPRQRSDSDIGEDPTDEPVADDERAEVEWLLAKAIDPNAPAPSPQLASEHAELEALLTSLPDGPEDESWHEAVLQKARASLASGSSAPAWWHRRWLQASIGGGLVAVAALALWILLPPKPATLEVTVQRMGNTRAGANEVSVGDLVLAKANPRGIGDLRVFRPDGQLFTKCPGGQGCVAAHEHLSIQFTPDTVGAYRVILASGMNHPLTEPSDSSLNAYIESARAARADIDEHVIEAH